MAPLYSRYVPPKAAQTQSGTQPEPVAQLTKQKDAQAIEADADHGRKKRKRTDADESNRKAPKHAKSKVPDISNTQVPVAKASGKPAKSSKPSDSHKAEKDKKEKKDKEKKPLKEAVNGAGEEAIDRSKEGEGTDSNKHTNVFSKFQKAARLSAKIQSTAGAGDEEATDDQDQPELHDIVPLPQKQREATPEYLPTFSALPDWLAHPIVVSQSTTKPFSELFLSQKTVAKLESKGWTSAFAVQSALLPLLLPHPYLTHLPPNDVCVSAPTGSGKTLGYVLPIIEALRNRAETKLRAVIVVPTRELVQQAYDVALACASGTGIRIAVAVGNQNLAVEQESLIKKGRTYDPEGYARLMEKAKRRIHHRDDGDDDADRLASTAATAARNAILADVVKVLPDHVPTYTSAIDVLICAPGRLVEHMNNTVGFNLDHVEWLVVDEADRLLDQSFQEWVPKVMGALEVTKPDPRREAVDLAMGSLFRPRKDRYVRKVILSATMTRDIAKLTALRLRRPSLIQVKSGEEEDDEVEGVKSTAVDGATVYSLPRLLREFAVPVGDGMDKPLFLLQLLTTRIVPKGALTPKKTSAGSESGSPDDDSDSSSDSSDSSSDDSSSGDDSDSESDSDSDSDSSSSSDNNDDTSSNSSKASTSSSATASITKPTSTSTTPTTSTSTSTPETPHILIFTGSTEEASRLHHLLTHLEPALTPYTTLLTRSTSSNTPFSSTTTTKLSPFTLTISTDRASRGLDLKNLTHVINYHMPRSLATYIHRVGRTARANRAGEAWTLFQTKEGRWFWQDIVRGEGRVGIGGTRERIERRAGVERVNLRLLGSVAEGGHVRKRYLDVLEGMKELVAQGQGRKGAGDEKMKGKGERHRA